ncbi:MAG TPA: hypothetical protein VKW04_09935 [Planctomycetota bacterium]|nr:hypothetical protein [Planctomycetota bacterium]
MGLSSWFPWSGQKKASDSRPPGLVMTVLVGGILLLLGALLFVQLAPALECPDCQGGARGIFTLDGPGDHVSPGCPTCNGRTRVTLLQKWKYKKAEEAR